MKRIFKIPLMVTDHQLITLPAKAKGLCVHEQRGALCLWAEVEDDNDAVTRAVLIYGTGRPLNHEESLFEYVGTALCYHGDLVWHVYMEREP